MGIAKEAQYQGVPADQVYCLKLVEQTGIIAVPGSGFGQKPGTHHIRLTILPDEETLEGVLDDIEKFHFIGGHQRGEPVLPPPARVWMRQSALLFCLATRVAVPHDVE